MKNLILLSLLFFVQTCNGSLIDNNALYELINEAEILEQKVLDTQAELLKNYEKYQVDHYKLDDVYRSLNTTKLYLSSFVSQGYLFTLITDSSLKNTAEKYLLIQYDTFYRITSVNITTLEKSLTQLKSSESSMAILKARDFLIKVNDAIK